MKAPQARILLTGASGGIGRAAAATFADAGARVMLAARSAQPLARLAAELRVRSRRGEDVPWLTCDLREQREIERLAQEAADWGCNVLVHAAGAPAFGPLAQEDAAAVAAVIQTNLVAPMQLTRALLPHLLRQPRAQVICVGSVLGAIGLPGYSVYGASKAGLRGFAQALRRELAETPVQVQYLGPRSTRTGFNGADVQAYNAATRTASDSPERVAGALLRMLEDGSAERFLGFPERLGVRINGAWPAALDGGFGRHRRSLAVSAPLQQRTES